MRLSFQIIAASLATRASTIRSRHFPYIEYDGTVFAYPILSGEKPSPERLDFSATDHIVLTRGFAQFDRDFVFAAESSVNAQSGLYLRLDISESVSWVHARLNTGKAYVATQVSPSRKECFKAGKLRNGVVVTMCESVEEVLNAGRGIRWQQQLWVNPVEGSGIAGSIGGNLKSSFLKNFAMYPRGTEIVLVPNPTAEFVSKACESSMTYVGTKQGSDWQVEGFVGISGVHGTYASLALATKGPIELSETAFEIFRKKVHEAGSYLTHIGDRTSYQAANCEALSAAFPHIAVEIGDFIAIVKPEHYIRYSSSLGKGFCHVDIMKAKDPQVLTVGPPLLRNIVTHLTKDRVGFCIPSQ